MLTLRRHSVPHQLFCLALLACILSKAHCQRQVYVHLRPLHAEEFLESLLGGEHGILGALRGLHPSSALNTGGGSFARAPNGDIVATVPLPALAHPADPDTDPEEATGRKKSGETADVKPDTQRTVAATLAQGGRALRIDASTLGAESRSRAVVTLGLPEQAVAVRATGIDPSGAATVVLVPRPGVHSAELPPLPANAALPSAQGAPAVRAEVVGPAAIETRSSVTRWGAGVLVLCVAFAALALLARQPSAVGKASNTNMENSGLTQVLSQRGVEGRDKDDIVLFEQRRRKGAIEKSAEKVS